MTKTKHKNKNTENTPKKNKNKNRKKKKLKQNPHLFALLFNLWFWNFLLLFTVIVSDSFSSHGSLLPYLELGTPRLSGEYLLNNKMEAIKNVRSAHVSDLKLLKEFYLVFGIYYKIHSFRKISIGEGKHRKKTIWLILLGVQLLRINTDQMTSSPEIRKWFLLIHSPWSCWRKILIKELR